MARSKTGLSAKRLLERLRSNESTGAVAESLGVQGPEVALARELVRHVGEHQAASAGRLPNALAQAVVEAAVQIEHGGFLKAVAEQGSKAASSAAKRGLAILRSRGIEVEMAPQGEAVFKTDAELEEVPCLLTTHDGHGDRVLWIPKPMRGGGLQLVSLIFSDTVGVVRVETVELSRKALRRLRDRLGHRGGMQGVSLVEIPLKRAQGYVALARSRTPSGLSIEDEAQLTHLIGAPEDAAAPAAADPELPAPLEEGRLLESASLHEEIEARQWSPEQDTMRSFDLRLEEIATSRLFLDDDQRHGQVQSAIDRAADAFFTGERAARWVARLFDLSDALRLLGVHGAAERAAAAARALRRGAVPSSVPFCRRMFDKLVAHAAAPEGATSQPQESKASSLILPGAIAE
jgi:hypothetical protein